MVTRCQKPTFFEKLSLDFRDQKKILLADLASAKKITSTTREEKMENKF